MKRLLLLFFVISTVFKGYTRENITKLDVKLIKTVLPKGLSMKADYFDQKIWINSPLIESFGSMKHQFYFQVYKDSGRFHVSGIHYRFSARMSGWLFFYNMKILTSGNFEDMRNGVGNRYEIYIPERKKDENIRVSSAVYVIESFDVYDDPMVTNWLKDIANNGAMSKIRIEGKNEYRETIIQNKGKMQKIANAIFTAREKIVSL